MYLARGNIPKPRPPAANLKINLKKPKTPPHNTAMETTLTETPQNPPSNEKNPEKTPVKRPLETTIQPVFRMLATIERLTASEIQRQIFSHQTQTTKELLLRNNPPAYSGPSTSPEEFRQIVENHPWDGSWEESYKNPDTQRLLAQALAAGQTHQDILAQFLENSRKLLPKTLTKLEVETNNTEKITCANLLHSLGENGPASGTDDLDLIRRIRTVKTLREQIVQRFLSSARAEFEHKTEREAALLAESLQKFLSASKEKEIFYCTRDLVEWGKQDFKRSSHTKIQGGRIPDEFLETAYCLIQICLGVRKTHLPKGTDSDAPLAAQAFTVIKNPLAKPTFPEVFSQRALALKQENFSQPLLADIKDIFEKLQPDTNSLALLEKEVRLFESSVEKVGTDLETYDELQKKEIESFKTIKKIHKTLTTQQTPKAYSETKSKFEKKAREEKLQKFLNENPLENPFGSSPIDLGTQALKLWEKKTLEQKQEIQKTLSDLLKDRRNHPDRLKTALRTLLTQRHKKTYGERILHKTSVSNLISQIRAFDNNTTPKNTQTLRQEISHTIKELRACTTRLEITTLLPHDYEPLLATLSPADIKAQIFQAIHKEKPGTEAAPALILTNQLSQNKPWLLAFLKNGAGALYTAPEAQNLFEIFESKQPTYEIASQEVQEETFPLHEAFRLIEIADYALANPKLQKAVEEELFLSLPIETSQAPQIPTDSGSPQEEVSAAEAVNLLKSLEREKTGLYATTKTKIEKAARRVHTEGLLPSDTEDPLEKTLATIKEKAQRLSQKLQEEMAGAQGSIESLPKLLRNKEEQDTTEASLVRTIAHFYRPNFQNGLEKVHSELLSTLSQKLQAPQETLEKSLITRSPIQYEKNAEKREISTLLSTNTLPTQHLSETEKKEAIHLIELLATTSALKDLCSTSKDEKTFQSLMQVLSHKTPPHSKPEHAFISLCDNVSLHGVKIKTADTLLKIEEAAAASETPLPENFSAIIKSNLYTLKDWREQETGITTINFLETNFQGYQKETDPKKLALSLCKTPEKLKELIRKDLKAALKTCLKPKMWKHPNTTTPKDIAAKNNEYLLLKKKFSDLEPNLFRKIQSLDTLTKKIEKELHHTPEDKALALSWHFKPKSQLQELFSVCDQIQNLKDATPSREALAEIFPKTKDRTLAQKLLKNPSLVDIARGLETNPKNSLGAIENSVLDSLLDCQNPLPALEYLETWNNAIGHQYYLTGQLEKPMHLPLIASRIQNKVFNLLELGKHIGRVAQNSDTLANTFVQQVQKQNKILRQKNLEERILSLQTQPHSQKPQTPNEEIGKLQETLQALKELNSTQEWVKRAKTQESKLDKNIEEKRALIEQKKRAFEEQDWDGLENGDEHKRLAKLQIHRDRRQLTQLVLKKERLLELLQISNTLKENPEIRDIASALVETPEAKNFGDALDKALKAAYSLASSPSLLPLQNNELEVPQEADIYDMLEASELQEEMEGIRKSLQEAGFILSQYNPKAHQIDYSEGNLRTITQELQDAAFECLRASELEAWAKGSKLWNPRSLQEELLRRNPSIVRSKEKWQKTLQDAEKSAIELLAHLEPRTQTPQLA